MASKEHSAASGKSPTDAELSIKLYPRQHDTWQGTAAQLTAEGLVPENFKWPTRTQSVSFTHRGIDCSIQRRRMPGTGRNGSWVNVDHWHLWRGCEGRGNNGAGLYEPFQAFMGRLMATITTGGHHAQ